MLLKNLIDNANKTLRSLDMEKLTEKEVNAAIGRIISKAPEIKDFAWEEMLQSSQVNRIHSSFRYIRSSKDEVHFINYKEHDDEAEIFAF